MQNFTISQVETLIRPDLLEFEEYTPIEPLEKLSQRLGIPIEKLVKLNANENPYGPAPAALEVLKNPKFYHHYPDPTSLFLREALERYIAIPQERILIGSGSDELLELIVKLFIQPGDNIIDLVPTFGMYSFLGSLYGAEVRSVPRHESNYAVDLAATLAAIDEHTKLIMVCTPNNPTGNLCPESVVRSLLETGRIVVVDEAYHDFSGYNFVALTQEYSNLIVLRTFSKLSGLAGLRVGYGIFPPAIIRHLWKIKQPYNVTVAAQVAASASISEAAWPWIEETVAKIVSERNRLFRLLQATPDIEPLSSQANFIFCRVKQGDAKAITQQLEQQGIFIRYYNKAYLSNSFRVSVGLSDQTDIFIAALRQLMSSASTSVATATTTT
jgi:histidinol-phosphate aminotransferase